MREILGKAIDRLGVLRGHVRVRMGVANRKGETIAADKTTLGEKVKEWEARSKAGEG